MRHLVIAAASLALVGIILGGMVGGPSGSPLEASASKRPKRATPTATAVASRTTTPIATTAPTATPTSTPIATTAPAATPTPTPIATTVPAATPTSTPTPVPTGTVTPTGPRMEKDANILQPGVQAANNLWLMVNGCQNAAQKAEGKGCLAVDQTLSAAFDSDSCDDDDDGDGLPCGDPNDPNLPQGGLVDPSGELPEGVGTWEEWIFFDNNIVTLEVNPDSAWLQSGGRIAACSYGSYTVHCVTEDDPNLEGTQLGPNGNGKIAQLVVYPRLNELKLHMRPTNNNGVVTGLIDENCEVADIFGQPLPGTGPGGLTKVCSNASITVRILEADVNLDCVVDASDEQAVANRYGSTAGTLLYSRWYDLEPQLADGDIDVKDLQFVFGRDGSTCQSPIPDQPAGSLP